MVAIIDYGVGNLFSLRSSLGFIGAKAVVTDSPEIISSADRIILPGVGAFGDAAEKLRASGLDKVVIDAVCSKKPVMGICLGMQLLFSGSYEHGYHKGLGLIDGEVVPMQGNMPAELPVPHIGWNALSIVRDCPILKYVNDGDHVYFVHSFYVEGDNDATVAVTDYGRPVTGTVQRGNLFGCQFHPEKSGEVGLSILRAFCEYEV